jgi:plasmid replication initiation protein
MANEIVKYHNDLNKISTRQWNAAEMDIFFSIVAKAKNKGLDTIELDKTDLMKLTNYAGEHNERFVKSLLDLVDHVSELKYRKYERNGNSNKLLIMNLFDLFEFSWTDDFSEITGKVKVSKAFHYILNNFDLSFTTFELDEFTKLRSTYSKTLYRQLKQYRKKGVREFKVDEFRYLMSIPESYKPMDIDRRVIGVSLKELAPIFKNLKVQKIKLKKKGSPIASYVFKWKPEKTNAWIPGQPQPNPNKPKKLSGNEELPKWYSDTEQHEPTQEMLERIEKMKKELQLSSETRYNFTV